MLTFEGKAWGRDFAARMGCEQFKVHSVFRSVCNLQATSARPLLALVNNAATMGPNALWVEHIDFAEYLEPGWIVLFNGKILRVGRVVIDCRKLNYRVFNY
ncbi:MAG: hypothetical protein M0Z55_05690, partial [Peptococcaceae bacterium]|nr:hypothetical protein [Peptococcaceae bacterium]